jgi:hypothetical protein
MMCNDLAFLRRQYRTMNRNAIAFGIGFLIIILLSGNLVFMSLGTNNAEAGAMPAHLQEATPTEAREALPVVGDQRPERDVFFG